MKTYAFTIQVANNLNNFYLGESYQESGALFNVTYDSRAQCVRQYQNEELDEKSSEPLANPSQLPIINTTQVLRGVDGIMPWFNSKHRKPFILIGPDGCGKSLVLKQCFTMLRSTQVDVLLSLFISNLPFIP